MPILNPFEQECLSHIQKNSFLYSHAVKRLFFQACLFLENQTPAAKEAIADYFAHAIMCNFVPNVSGAGNIALSRYIIDYKKNKHLMEQLEENKTLINFFKQSILTQQKEMLPKYKLMLADLEITEIPGLIKWAYSNTVRLEKILPPANFNSEATKACRKALQQQTKNKKQKEVFEIILLILMCSTYCALDYYNNENDDNSMSNIVITLIAGLLAFISRSSYVVFRFRQNLDKILTLTLEFIPSIPKKVTQARNDYVMPKVDFTSPPATHRLEHSESYKLSVFPTPIEKIRQPKRWQLWTQPENKVSEPEIKQNNITILPNYFGAAFNHILEDEDKFVKLEGGGFGPQSQLYGIWNVEGEPVSSLHERFKSGKLVAPNKPGIKQLVIDGVDGNYWEIKGSGADRVIGKEFTTRDRKTVIVFTRYESDGLHGGKTNNNRRIIQHVDSDIQTLHDINASNGLPHPRIAMR